MNDDSPAIQQKRRSSKDAGKEKSRAIQPRKSEGKTRAASSLQKEEKFGKLTSLQPLGRDKSNNVIWLFRCDCGTEKPIRANHVLSGRIVSCSCEAASRCARNFTSHGKTSER